MKNIRLVSFCLITLLWSVFLHMAIWKSMQYIHQDSIIEAFGASIGIYITFNVVIMRFLIGTIQSAMLNVFNYNDYFHAALAFNYGIPAIVGIVSIMWFMFTANYESRWVLQFITYWVLLGSIHITLNRVSSIAEKLKKNETKRSPQ